MEEWVTTKDASLIKKVGLSHHRIAERARKGEIVAKKPGKKKWLVKVILNDGQYELVKVASVNPTTSNQQLDEIASLQKEKLEREVKKLRLQQYTMDTGKLI